MEVNSRARLRPDPAMVSAPRSLKEAKKSCPVASGDRSDDIEGTCPGLRGRQVGIGAI